MNIKTIAAGAGVLSLTGSAFALPQIVNVDFNGNPTGGDQTYVGDDGALSHTGGTTWNGVNVYSPGASNLLDEFSNPTSLGVVITNGTGQVDAGSPNTLYDSGIDSNFFIVGLDPAKTYNVVGYVLTNGGFIVTDSNGSQGFQGFGFDPPHYALPGVQGGGPMDVDGDYMRFDNLVPDDFGNGIYALSFSLDGTIVGLQVECIPTPATLGLASIALVPGLKRRRR